MIFSRIHYQFVSFFANSLFHLLSISSQRMRTNLNLKKNCWGSPPPADSLSLRMPDWPAEINIIHDSKYWPIIFFKKYSTRNFHFFRIEVLVITFIEMKNNSINVVFKKIVVLGGEPESWFNLETPGGSKTEHKSHYYGKPL